MSRMKMEKDLVNDKKKKKKYKYGIAPYIVFLIGLMTFAAQFFGYMEAELLNTYIDHVLNLDYIYIGIMVSFSATMGLIFLFVWGVVSDNTRNHQFGRRAPYLLIGGLGSGIGMILFGYSETYFWCFFLDVIIIGIFSNAFYAAQRVLVPDLVDLEYRGRVNSLIGIFSIVGLVFPVLLTFLANEFFTAPNPDPHETGRILTQEGHIILLTIGGLIMIICGIIGFLFIKDRTPVSELPPKKSFRAEMKETFNIEVLKKNREFFKLIIAMTLYMAGVNAVLSYLFNFIFSLEFGEVGSTTGLIIVLGIAAPVLIVTILLLGLLTDKIGRKKIIPPTILISCIGFILVPIIAQAPKVNVVLLGIAFSFILLGILGVIIPMNTWSQDLLPEGKKGQFFGIFNIANTVSQVIGSISAALFVSAFKGVVPNPIAMIFAIVPIFFLLSIPFFLKVKETLPEEYREHIL
ncbi:MAG: MFS transporter [Promethearchaeota archaeon]